ncbi:hypothetical protein GJ700_32020 [Duganella sp. FT92W]|uniref:Glycine-rich domain-containing protein-like n=1 Tax=Pseudoduganella rivuli TaxID=2666085 RepID=A0A7X2IUI0_9BURK|nr:hypothetical protein [Pseudoduganella rivuli]MRV76347.1 hypothetical protein [Pseudoduganella rivuli]
MNDAYKAIAELDLEPIKVKLMHQESGEGWSLERANAIEFEYRRFLILMKKYPDEQTAPLVDVDTFWHYHILDTLKYAADCEAVFGYFLHHFPYIGLRGEADEEAHHRVGQRMKELYEETFGEDYIRTAAGNDAAYSGIATAAYSGIAAQDKTAYSGIAAQTAYSGIAAQGKAAQAGAQTAYSGIAAKTAYSGIAAQGKADQAGTQTAYSGIAAKTAYSGIAAQGKAEQAGAQTAYSGIATKTAYSGIAAQGQAQQAGAETAYSGIASGKADIAAFYTTRPRLPVTA